MGRDTCSIFFLLIQLTVSTVLTYDCPCSNKQDCEHPTEDLGTTREVYVFSNGSTDVSTWRWETISTLVVPSYFNISNPEQANTMCVAHRHGRKFSITVDMTLSNPISQPSSAATDWVKGVIAEHGRWHAELITVDLLKYLSKLDGTDADHKALAQVLLRVKEDLDEVTDIPIKMACIVPWKPPCTDGSKSCSFAYLSNDVCDSFVLTPDSFVDEHDTRCIAKATIPYSKLLYGISEYNDHGVPRGKMILGVPWHGYDYECAELVNDVCTLRKDPVTNLCDFSRRTTVTSSYVAQHRGMAYDTHLQTDLYQAPQYTYTQSSQEHQVWFEDHYSLSSKYKLANELNMKGIAVMYGDDLSQKLTTHGLVNNAVMWSWILHEFHLAKSTAGDKLDHTIHVADSVAGLAIGCLLLGVALGTLLTCLGLSSRMRKPKHSRPSLLVQQDDRLIDSFHDEEDRHL